MRKYLLAPASLPEHLIWHKWQSYWTWMSGFALLCWVYYGQSSLYLIDPAVMALEPWQAALIGIVALALGWIVYDLLCRSPLANNEPLLARRRLRLCGGDKLGLHPVFLRPRRAHPHRRPHGDDHDRQRVLRHHAQPAQKRRRADGRAEARSEMGQELQGALDAQQLHHPAGAVPDAVEPLSIDLLQCAGHSGDRHLRHRRRRAGALFLQRLASRSRPCAVVGMGGGGVRDPLRLRLRRDRFARHALAHGAGGASRPRPPRPPSRRRRRRWSTSCSCAA